MILYFADRHLNILGQATTHLPEGVRVIKDLKTEDVDTGVAIFECRIPFDRKTRAKVEEWAEVGNYILRSSDNENEFYNITDAEIDTKRQEVYIYAEDDGLDLLNDVAEAYEADQPYPISSYIERFAAGAGWEIGINEVEGLTKKLSWDSEQTASARLLSIAEGFNNCELSYSFEINGLQISKKYINIYEERGKDTGIQLRLNKEIDSIITTKSITNLATALNVTGGTPADADAPITLLGYEYDDGDFYVDGKVLKSRKALDKWSRYLWRDDETKQSGGHIVKSFSYATTSQAVLCEKAIEKLKTICDMEVNYDVDISKFPENVKVGDRVNIVDDAGELYLSSRVLILETSVSDMTKKAVLGEHLIKKDGISEKVEELAAQFAEIAQSRVFYTWIAYADDENGTNITTDSTGKEYIGIAANRTEEEVDISDPSVFTWSKIKGEDGEPGSPGEPGESPFNVRFLKNGFEEMPNNITFRLNSAGELINNEYLMFDIQAYFGNTVAPARFGIALPNDDLINCFRNPDSWGLPNGLYKNGEYQNSARINIMLPKGYKPSENTYIFDFGVTLDDKEAAPSIWTMPFYYYYMHFIKEPVSISTVTEKYQVSDSKTDAPTTWKDVAPEMTAELPYLWNYEIITYSDGSTEDTTQRVIGMYAEGKEGRGIKEITNYYAVNNDPLNHPTNWEDTMQTTSVDKPYLWTKEFIEYTDGTTKQTNPIIIGTHGATGAAGVAYSMITNVGAIVRTASGKYIPESIILYGRSQSGTDTISPYAGRFKIDSTSDNVNWTENVYQSTNNENEVTFKVPADIKALRCSFYKGGGFTTKLDEQTIPVVSDGLDGDGYTVILTNDSHTFAATYDGKAVPGHTTCKVFAYKGGSRVSATIGEVTDIPNGMSVSVNSAKNGTVDAEFTVTVDSNMITESGTITVPVTVDGKSFEKLMTYSLALAGPKGDKGDPGVSIDTVTEYYARSTSSTTAPADSSFSTSVPTLDATYKYLWNYEVITYTGGKTATTTPKSVIGVFGADGKGISSITEYYLATSSSSGVTTSTSGWKTTPQTTTDTNKYLWNYEVITYTDNSKHTTTPIIIGVHGEKGDPGKSISGVTNYYLASSSSSGVTTSTSGWTEAVQTPTKDKKYLWNYEKVNYSDNTSTTTAPCIIGNFAEEGKEGISISSVTEYYAKSSSSSSAPADSSFSTSVPTLDATNKYLWNYEVITYTGGKAATTTPKCVIGVFGKDGDPGKGIKSTAITYQASSSGTVTPTGTWLSYIPTLSAGQYLWTKTVITYTDNTTSTSYSVGMMGATGSAGKGVKSTAVTYQSHTNGTSAPTGTWSSSVVSVNPGNYLWTRTVITYTDDTTSTSYSVSKVGNDGQMLYATSSTGASTTAKTATLSTGSISSLTAGLTVTVKFTYGNTATSPTLNVNSTGAKYIALKNKSLNATNQYYWKAYDVITFVYDGTYWNIVDVAATRNRMTSEGLIIGDYSGDTLGSNVLITSSDVKIRNDSTVYATYGANLIELGKNNSKSTIDLCNGSAKMKLNSDDYDVQLFEISAANGSIGLSARNRVMLHSMWNGDLDYGFVRTDVDSNQMYWEAKTYRKDTDDGTYEGYIQINDGYSLTLSSSVPDHSVDLALVPEDNMIYISGGGLNVRGSITASSMINANGHILLPNEMYLYGTSTINCGKVVETLNETMGYKRSLIHYSASNNTVIGWGGWYAGEGATRIYGNKVAFIVGTSDDSTTYRPYFSAGDEIPVTWTGAGYISASSKGVYFTIPLAKPVIGNPTITVESDGGMKIRQNGVYCYGSGASAYATGTYKGELSADGNFIRISATMTNTTNVTNNDTCGIEANLKITFS